MGGEEELPWNQGNQDCAEESIEGQMCALVGKPCLLRQLWTTLEIAGRCGSLCDCTDGWNIPGEGENEGPVHHNARDGSTPVCDDARAADSESVIRITNSDVIDHTRSSPDQSHSIIYL